MSLFYCPIKGFMPTKFQLPSFFRLGDTGGTF